MNFLELRQPGYALLTGTGIEIGGFEHPARPPHIDRVIRCDRLQVADVARIFPEVNTAELPGVDCVVDMDVDGLAPFETASLDFVICCHVLEHLKNPIRALDELFRVLLPGGKLALGIPDRNYTFDRTRPLTPNATLEDFYRRNVTVPLAGDYMDIVRFIHPQMLAVGEAERNGYLEYLKERREHLNIWDTPTFVAFLETSGKTLGRVIKPVYEVTGEQSQFEYFAVLEKVEAT